MSRRGDFKTKRVSSDRLIIGCPKNEVDKEAGGEDGSPFNIDGIYESALDLIDSALRSFGLVRTKTTVCPSSSEVALKLLDALLKGASANELPLTI
ncbi:hypothetical protein N8787_02635 [Opitutaceae bacterium]|nr:hypothetical protein [Opitutaceae bacterium]